MKVEKNELFILNQRRSEAQRLLVATYDLIEPATLTVNEIALFNQLVNSLNDNQEV